MAKHSAATPAEASAEPAVAASPSATLVRDRAWATNMKMMITNNNEDSDDDGSISPPSSAGSESQGTPPMGLFASICSGMMHCT
eukprot:1192126-Rhodomonas_salina.1